MSHAITHDEVVGCSEEVLKEKLQALRTEKVRTQNAMGQYLIVEASIRAVEGELASIRGKEPDNPARSCYTYL